MPIGPSPSTTTARLPVTAIEKGRPSSALCHSVRNLPALSKTCTRMLERSAT